jgi:hypothetical protein
MYAILSIPTALLAESNVPAQEQLLPILSPIPVATPGAPDAKISKNSTFASHPAVPATVSLSEQLPMEQLVAAAAGRTTGTAFKALDLHIPAGSLSEATAEPPMKLFKPHETASAGHELNPKDAAKPAKCANDQRFVYLDNVIDAACRVYMYRDAAGMAYDICTGWFVVTAGSAVAPGGTAKYNVVAVKGRYRTVCCGDFGGDAHIPTGGPDNCPAAFNYNIIKAVTTTGWLNKGQLSNSGAVLKVVGLSPAGQGSNFPAVQADPLCFSGDDDIFSLFCGGYPNPSPKVGGCSNIQDGSPYVIYPSYSTAAAASVDAVCTPALDSPY